MTAMVDVAFLLLTFFILTTTMAQPNAMQMLTPSEEGEGQEVKCSTMLELYPGAEGKVHWYKGCDRQMRTLDAGSVDLRQMLLEQISSDDQLVITIKPTAKAAYATFVDVMDELSIVKAKRYAIAPLSPQDQETLDLYNLK
jgi:biopolymer transport protein ExbD